MAANRHKDPVHHLLDSLAVPADEYSQWYALAAQAFPACVINPRKDPKPLSEKQSLAIKGLYQLSTGELSPAAWASDENTFMRESLHALVQILSNNIRRQGKHDFVVEKLLAEKMVDRITIIRSKMQKPYDYEKVKEEAMPYISVLLTLHGHFIKRYTNELCYTHGINPHTASLHVNSDSLATSLAHIRRNEDDSIQVPAYLKRSIFNAVKKSYSHTLSIDRKTPDGDWMPEPRSHDPGPSMLLMQQEENARLYAALSRLRPEYQDVLRVAYFSDGFSSQRAAGASLNLTDTGYVHRLDRAKAALAKQFRILQNSDIENADISAIRATFDRPASSLQQDIPRKFTLADLRVALRTLLYDEIEDLKILDIQNKTQIGIHYTGFLFGRDRRCLPLTPAQQRRVADQLIEGLKIPEEKHAALLEILREFDETSRHPLTKLEQSNARHGNVR